MRGSRALIALLLAAGLAGCGSSGPNTPTGLTGAQARGLVAQLETVRARAGARDVAGTKAALASFRRSVVRLRQSGALNDATARSLRIGAARILQRVEEDNPPAAPVQTATTPAPAPVPPGQKKKHGEKPGKGKGHKGKDD